MMYGLILICLGCLSIINGQSEAGALQEFSEGNIKFSSDIYEVLASQSGDASIVFSPLSVQLVLSQTSEGARNNTAEQLISVLGLPSRCLNRAAIQQLILNTTSDIFSLVAANRIYVADNYELLQSFRDVSEQVYQSDAVNVDFSQNQQTADLINAWIAEQTNDKIQNLVNPNALSGLTRLMLVNTLYIEGKWITPFSSSTVNGTFTLPDGSTKEVPMMHSQSSSSYNYLNSEELRASFLQIDLQNSNLSMTFILPNNLNELGLIENNLENYLSIQNLSRQRVAVTIPSFEITSDTMELAPILQQLGITDLFNEATADLSGISGERGIFVSGVAQKAFINVTITGVEAAAATTVGISITSVQLPPEISFTADRSFFYSISDRITGIVYFVGRYTGL